MAQGILGGSLSDFSKVKVYEALALSVHHCYINLVEGDIAEFGTHMARTATAIAEFMSSAQAYQEKVHKTYERMPIKPKRFHLFDSFKGMPKATHEADIHSPHVDIGVWSEGKLVSFSAEQVKQKVAQFLPIEDIITYEGFFSETLSRIDPSTKFSMVHIDCDLYQSAIEVLDHLFGNRMISMGAVILFDDWNCFSANNDAGERRAWKEAVARFNISSSDIQFYGSSQAKVLIYNYDQMEPPRLGVR